MLETILVPLDGSAFSEQALPLAVRLAARHHARLDLVMAIEPAVPLDRVHGAPVFDPRLDQELRRAKFAYVAGLADRIERTSSVPTAAIVREGPVADTVASTATERRASLVVMTTHGRGGVSRVWLGSVAESLLRRLAAPMLVLRASDAMGARGLLLSLPRRVLVALDGTDFGEGVLEDTINIAGATDVTYVLVRVTDPAMSPEYTAEIVGLERDRLAERRAAAVDYLERVAAGLRSRGLTVETRQVGERDPARGILDCARDSGADLIALSTHGRGRLARLVLGSVADAVVRQALVPVLVRGPVETPSVRHATPTHDHQRPRAGAVG